MQRREFFQTTGLSMFGAALPVVSTRAQDRHAKYRGQTLVLSAPDHPHYDAMLTLLPAFTRETGIKVDIHKLPLLSMKGKQLSEMSKREGGYDLICYVVTWKSEYVKKGLIRALEPFLASAGLADPAFDLQDIVPAYLANVGMVGGPKGDLVGPGAKLYGLPYGAETSILAYRRDIFAKHNLKPPRTYVELQALLHPLKDKEGIGALTSRGQAGHPCVHAWLLHLNPMGGKIFDADWKPRFNDEIGVKALSFLKEVSETGPAGIPNYGQGEMMNAFLQGEASMYLDSTVIFGPIKNPSSSKIAGKVGYALHPKGVRYASESGGLGLAIPKNAKNADAAFLLMQWLTSKQQDIAVATAGGVPTRMSTLANPDLVRRYPEYITLREQLRYSDPDWRPTIPEWDEINVKVLGVAISEALTGKKSPKEALDGVAPKVTGIMKRGGYLKG